MPAPELSHRLQRAVLWEKSGYDRYGQPTVSEPVEIAVRWNDTQTVIQDPQGNNISVDATVVVARNIPNGSAMWLGKLKDWYKTGSAGDESNVMEVKVSYGTPDIKNRVPFRTVGLMKKSDKTPNIA